MFRDKDKENSLSAYFDKRKKMKKMMVRIRQSRIDTNNDTNKRNKIIYFQFIQKYYSLTNYKRTK